MNCESLPLLMNAALDGELSAADRTAMEQHLAECSSCRESWSELQALNHDLTVALSRPSLGEIVDHVMDSIGQSETRGSGPNESKVLASKAHVGVASAANLDRPARRDSKAAFVAVAMVLIVCAVVILRPEQPTPAIAEIALATGSIDIQKADSLKWVSMPASSRVALAPRTRVRTQSTSLCEIRTSTQTVVRLKEQTELIVHRPEKVELVSGELWCRTPTTCNMEICSSPPAKAQPAKVIFTCPSSAETQWRAMPDNLVSCQDVSSRPVDITVGQSTYLMQSGQSLTFQSGEPNANPKWSDPLVDTTWQFPLLALRSPVDSELQQRLIDLLAKAGQSKAAYLYDSQIRSLGPVGAIPLLAYVRSPDSVHQPDLRLRAMNLASELAPPSCLSDLESLQHDDDPTIRQLADRAVNRLRANQGTR